MYSVRRTAALPAVGFPIRTSSDQSLVSGSPGLFAATHVLLRLLSPRHPSCALCSLVIFSLLVSPSSPPRSKTRVQRGVVNRRTFPTTHLAYLRICSFQRTVVGLGRFELPTPRLSSVCSNQLSYRPDERPFQRTGVLRPVSQN